MRRIRKSRRGATLIEAMIALGALGVGTAGVVTLLTYVSQTNRRSAFQNRSLDLASEFTTQVRDAACDVPVGGFGIDPRAADPGLVAPAAQFPGRYPDPLANTVRSAVNPIAGSGITLVGRIAGVPPVYISYSVRREVGGPPDGPPALDVEMRIREITGSPERDDLAVTEGYWIRTFPVKKVCNQRLEEFGRGEYY